MDNILYTKKDVIAGGLTIAGMIVSLLASFPDTGFTAGLCGMLGDGCRDTDSYRLLQLPLQVWGIGYYAMLAGVFFFRRNNFFHLVMAGTGVELSLIIIMIKMKFICAICLLNFFIIAGLLVCFFEKKRLYESIAILLLFNLFAGILIKGNSAKLQAPSKPPGMETIYATIGNHKITAEQVDRPVEIDIYKLENKIYRIKRRSLRRQINAHILKEEAKKKGLSITELKDRVTASLPVPEEGLIDSYYKSGSYKRWGIPDSTKKETKIKIAAFLHNRMKQQKIDEYCFSVKDQYPVRYLLEEPTLPHTNITIGGSPSTGPSGAPVTIVEFSDYHCPACRKSHETVKKIRDKYKGKLRWVFKDFPLEMHKGAKELALAAACAQKQGRFWKYQDRLFSGRTPPGMAEAVRYAKELGLNSGEFTRCLSDESERERLEAGIAEARKAGVSSTPTLIINGRLRAGVPSFEKLCELIDAALAEAGKSSE